MLRPPQSFGGRQPDLLGDCMGFAAKAPDLGGDVDVDRQLERFQPTPHTPKPVRGAPQLRAITRAPTGAEKSGRVVNNLVWDE